MEPIIEQCLNEGICSGQAAFGRDVSLREELTAAIVDWSAGFSPPPTDEMLAAWLIGYAGVLAQHYELIAQVSKTGAI